MFRKLVTSDTDNTLAGVRLSIGPLFLPVLERSNPFNRNTGPCWTVDCYGFRSIRSEKALPVRVFSTGANSKPIRSLYEK